MNKEKAMERLRALPHLKDLPNSGPRALTNSQFAKRQELVSIIESATRNVSYIVERNRLIPQAEAYANQAVTAEERARWGRIFLKRMDELHAELKAKKGPQFRVF